MRVSHLLCVLVGVGVGFLSSFLASSSRRPSLLEPSTGLLNGPSNGQAVDARAALELERNPQSVSQEGTPLARREALATTEGPVPEGLWAELERLCVLGVLNCPEDPVRLVALHLAAGSSSAEQVAHATALVRRWPPKDATVYHRLVMRLLQLGDHETAHALVELSMTQVVDVRALASSLLSVGELERAESLLGPYSWNEWKRLAKAYKKRGDLAEAVRIHRELVERGMFLNDSIAVLSEHDPSLLEQKLRKDLEEQPDSHSIRSLAKLLHETGRSVEGIALLEENKHLLRGNRFLETLTSIDPDEARARFDDEAFAQLPRDQREYLWWELAETYEEAGRFDAAIEGWIENLSMTSDDPWGSMEKLLKHAPERGLALMERRATEVADPATRPRGMKTSDVADFQDCLGDHAWTLGKKELAIRAWKKAQEFDEEDTFYGRKAQAAEAGEDPMSVD